MPLFSHGASTHVLCALARCIFCQWCVHFGMLRSRLFRRGGWCCCSLFCGFLNIGAPGLLLRYGCRGALRPLRFWSGAYIVRVLAQRILCRWRGWRNLMLTRLFRRGERCCCSLFCSFLNIRAPGLLLRHGCRGALRPLRFRSGPWGICTLPRRFRCMV